MLNGLSAPMSRGMNRLDAPLRGLVLDDLWFHELLRLTETCRSWRGCLSSVTRINWITVEGLRAAHMMNKMTRCRVLKVSARSFDLLRDMILPMAMMRDLQGVTIEFDDDADTTSFAPSCDLLVRSGALRTAPNLQRFELQMEGGEPLDDQLLERHAFKGLLDQMPLDCALRAAVRGRVPASWVSEILSKGADPNANPDPVAFDNIIHEACEYQSIDVIRLLVDAGADPHRLNDTNQSILHGTASWRKSGVTDVLRYLLDLGLNARHVELQLGWTVLHFLLSNKQIARDEMLESVELLLSHDPSLASIPNKDGDTALTFELTGDDDYNEMDANHRAILHELAEAEAKQRRTSTARSKFQVMA